MDTARSAMAEVVTFALEIDIVLDIRTGGLAIEVPVKYAGDLHAIGYSSADLTITIPFQVIESKLITSSGTSYIFDDVANTWEPLPGDSPFFAGPSVFLGSDASDTADVVLVRSETLDGVETQVVSAKRPSVEIGGATGDLDVLYWIGVDDGLLRKVEASGFVEFGEEGIPGLDFSVASANATLAARFFDYGKAVDIISPELIMPRFLHEAFLLDDGRVFITDGFTGFANNDFIVPIPVAILQIYDIETGLWSLEDPILSSMYIARQPALLISAVMLQDGRVFVIGLSSESEEIAGSGVAFDPTIDSWTPLPGPSVPRGVPDMELLNDGRVLVVGGLDIGSSDSSSQPDSVSAAEIFYPETNEWQQAAAMNQAAEDQATVLLSDGRVLVVGGTMSDGRETARAELYDPATDTWTSIGNMSVERGRPKAILLSDGRVLVTGDGRLDFGAITGSSEIYDPDTDKWTSAAGMSYPRIGHTLTALPDGRVLAAGGENPTGSDYLIYSTTEIFDPVANSWSPGPELSEPRSEHSTTLLPDGRVLVVGGIGQEDERYPLTSMEFVTP